MQRIRTWEMVPAELRVRNRTLPFSAGDGSTLSLDFTETSALDPRFTFTRSSNATYVNSNGIIAFADNNLVVNSTFGSLATPQGWSGSTGVSLTTPSVGVRRAVTTTAAQNWIQTSNIATSAGLTYSTSVYINDVSGQQYSNTISITASPTSVTYYRNGVSVGPLDTAQPGIISMTWTASTSFGHGLRIGVGASGASGTNVANAVCEFTEPQTSRGTNAQPNYFANESTSSAYYAPRFDYSPTTLAPRGLLMEGSATNLVSYSEDFSNAAWTKSGTNSSMPQTGTAPDNNATSRLFEENTTSFVKHGLERSISISAGIHTFSVWLKEPSSNSRRYAHIQLADGQAIAARYTIVVDLQTGTITASGANNGTAGAPTGTGHNITPYPNGWYRVTISMNHVASPSYPVVMLGDSASLYGGNNQPFYSATTPYKGLLVWGAQLQVGFDSSSYIQTASSQVQRSSDQMTMANISALNFNQSGGTVFMRLQENPRDQDTFPYFAAFEVSPSGRGWSFARFNNSVASGRRLFPIAFNAAGSTIIASSAVSRSGSGQYKFATTLEPSVARMTVVVSGGSPVVTTATGGILSTIGALKFNNTTETASTDFASVWIAELKYWPTVLPNSTLQSITA